MSDRSLEQWPQTGHSSVVPPHRTTTTTLSPLPHPSCMHMDVAQNSERQTKGPPPSCDRNASLMHHTLPNQNMAIGHYNSESHGTRPISSQTATQPHLINTSPHLISNVSPEVPYPAVQPPPLSPKQNTRQSSKHIYPYHQTNQPTSPHPSPSTPAKKGGWENPDPSPTTSHHPPLLPVQSSPIQQCSAVQCTTDSHLVTRQLVPPAVGSSEASLRAQPSRAEPSHPIQTSSPPKTGEQGH
jgi:hypothetical protein